MLSRLVSQLDTLAKLAALRTGDRSLRSGGSSWKRCRTESDVPHSAVLGGDHHRTRCAAASDLAALWHAHNRGRGRATDRDHSRLLLARNIRSSADPPEFSGDGQRANHAEFSTRGNDLCRDRNYWRHRDASQFVPAFGAGAKPQAAEGRRFHSQRHPL